MADIPLASFDEVHVGQQASYYITRQFYFDVHPPVSTIGHEKERDADVVACIAGKDADCVGGLDCWIQWSV